MTFLPKVTLPLDKDRVILRYSLEINGELFNGGSDYDNNYNEHYTDLRLNRANIDFYTESKSKDCNTAEFIAEYLILGSNGLFYLVKDSFQFTPARTLSAGESLTIGGMTVKQAKLLLGDDAVDYDVFPAAVKLTFMVIDNLPADAVDFTQEVWGSDVSICSSVDAEYVG